MNAASAAAFLMVKGRPVPLHKNGQRLALTTFLTAAALWAQVAFIASTVDPSSVTACQAAIAISSGFDLLSRVALLQFLLWASAGASNTAAMRLVPQGLLLVRLSLGGVFIGMQRPQFKPVCVPKTDILPVAIAVIGVDAVLILACLARVLSAGGLRDAMEGTASYQKARGVYFTLGGFILWMGVSVGCSLYLRFHQLNVYS